MHSTTLCVLLIACLLGASVAESPLTSWALAMIQKYTQPCCKTRACGTNQVCVVYGGTTCRCQYQNMSIFSVGNSFMKTIDTNMETPITAVDAIVPANDVAAKVSKLANVGV